MNRLFKTGLKNTDRIIKQKEESLKTVIDTIEKNQKFKKLLIYFMNSLEVYISPPNRDIKINAKIIIRLQGVRVLRAVAMVNIQNEEIVEEAADIIWKLIGIYDIVDQELAKLFVEQGGHEAVIEILLQKDPGKASLPLIKILNGLVQVPQLVNTLLDAGLAQTVKLVNDLYPDDLNIIALNFDTMKKISNQKNGRDFMIEKGLVPSILANIKKCAEYGEPAAVMNGFYVLDNIARSEEGKKEIKDADGIEIISEVLSIFDENEKVLKQGAKVYAKIVTEEDMVKLLKQIEENGNKVDIQNPDPTLLRTLRKDLGIASNLMLLDQIGLVACRDEHFKALKALYLKLNQLPLDGKPEEFARTYVNAMRNYMVIFERIFKLMPECYDKNSEKGLESSELHLALRNAIRKNYEALSSRIDSISKTEDPQKWVPSHYKSLRDYFSSYDNLILQEVGSIKEGEDINPDIIKVLLYVTENIISKGLVYFCADDRSNYAASKLLYLCTKVIDKYPNSCQNLPENLEKCFPYMSGIIQINKHNKTLIRDLKVCKYITSGEKTEAKQKNIDELIPIILTFMNEKPSFRNPNYVNLEILDEYLNDEYINLMRTNPDPKISPNFKLDYISGIVSVMSKVQDKKKKSKKKESEEEMEEEEVQDKEIELIGDELEQKIEDKGSIILSRLVTLEDYIKQLKIFNQNAKKFVPGISKNEDYDKLLDGIFFQKSLINNKANLDATLAEELAVKELIKKELTYIEGYKRDTKNEKDPKFMDTIQASSDRLSEYLELLKKLDNTTIKQHNLTKDPKYLTKYKDILQTDLDVFDKSTDCRNIEGLTEQAKVVFPFINQNENDLQLGKPTDPKSIERLINSMLKTFRNNINDEPLDKEIIKTFISIATQKPEACNLLVKGGCPRLLLQVMENTSDKDLCNDALELLKMITLSSNDNLVMVANQNVALKLFEIRSKNASDEDITKKCDLIVNEIMKLPGQEEQAISIIKDCIKDLHDSNQKDFNDSEVKNKILNDLEIINSFTSNKKIVESTILDKEFFDDLEKAADNSIKDQETSERNQNLVANSVSLAKKVQENMSPNAEDLDDKNNKIVKIILDDIKNKSNYAGVLLTSCKKLGSMINDEPYYKKYVDDKINEEFVDKLLEISENYLDNPEVSKEINNILCGLCLRNSKLGNYIVSKGGLVHVIEDLKGTVNMNDDKSKEIKLNGLKMLDSLLNEDKNLEKFVESKGVELLNGIVKNEVAIAPQIKASPCMFKTRGTINVKTPEMLKDEEKVGKEVAAEDKVKEKEDYFVYCVKIMKKGIDKGKKEFVDEGIIKNLTLLAEANYPDKELFAEVTNILTNESCVIPEVPADNQNLIKLASSNRSKFYPDEKIKENVENLRTKVGPQTFGNEDYKEGIKKTIPAELEKKDDSEQRKELNKLVTYIALNLDSKDFTSTIDAKEDILPLYNRLVEAYQPIEEGKPHPDIDEGTAIALMKIGNYLVDNGQLDIQDPTTIGILTKEALPFHEPENYIFNKHYDEELDKLLAKAGKLDQTKEQSKDKPQFTEPYNEYLIKSFPSNSAFLRTYHKDFLAAPQGTYPELSKEKEENLDKALEKVEDFYRSRDGGEDLKEKNILPAVGDVIDLIDDISIEGVYKKDDENNEDTKKMKNRAIKTWKVVDMAIAQDEGNNVLSDDGLTSNLIDAINDTLKLGIDIPELRNIMLQLSDKVDNKEDLLKKMFDYAKNDMETHPDDKEAKSKDIEILANISKFTEPLKDITKDEKLWNDLKKEYEKEDISDRDRKNIDEILRNATKNQFNTEKMVKEEPELFKSLKEKILDHPITGETEDDDETAKKEVEVLIDAMKDPNNFKQLLESKAIAEEDLDKLAEAYQSTKPEVNKLIRPVIQQIKEQNKGLQEEKELKKDEENLKELTKAVEEAFNQHKQELAAISKDSEDESKKEKEKKIKKKATFKGASEVRQGRMSFITDTLLFNPNNNDIKSMLSTKTNNEMPLTLDQILSILRKLYNEYKTSDNSELNQKRELLIGECLRLLKNLSLSPDNHKIILENGLVNFGEKLASEEQENNPIMFHVRSKDVMKNCTHSEIAVPAIIESPLFDKLIKELLAFYDGGEEALVDDNQRLIFLYDNIIFSNVCKNKKGFEIVFKKIGRDKLIAIGQKTGNSDILEAIIRMLINFIKHQQKLEDLDQQFWKDVIQILAKALDLKGRTVSLLSAALTLISLIYLPWLADNVNRLETVSHVNYDFEQFNEEKQFIDSSLRCLAVITKDNVHNSNDTVNSKLIVKLKDAVLKLNKAECQEIILNLTLLYNSLVNNNIDNVNNFIDLGLTDNILYLLDLYSTKVYGLKAPEFLKGFSQATMNLDVINQSEDTGINKKSAFIKRMTTANFDASKILAGFQKGENSSYVQTLSNSMVSRQESDKNNKQITVNLINTLDQMTVSTKANEYLGKTKLANFLTQMLKNPGVDIDVTATVLHVFGNYLYQVKANNEKLNLEEIYQILQSLQKTYYSNSDVLANINYICGSIIKNIENKEYIKKFFILISESTKCQDWNVPLIIVALKVIYENLRLHPFLIDEVFEDLFPLLLNIQKVHKDNIEIQNLVFKIIALFSKNQIYGSSMLNGGLMESVKITLENPVFDKNPNGKATLRKLVFGLMETLAVDEGSSKKISDDLMEFLLKELDDETFVDDNTPIILLLTQLCNAKYCLQPFVQFRGIEITDKWLNKEEQSPEFISQLLDLLTLCVNGGDEYKGIMQKLEIIKTLNNIIKIYGLFEKEIEIKAKKLIFLINLAKPVLEELEETEIQDIKIENPIKAEVRNFLTSGKQVIIVNKAGDKKEMHLSFTQDLLKVSAKKIKSNLPPKPKYQIDTSTIKRLVKGHGGHDKEIDGKPGQYKPPDKKSFFRKAGGIFSSPPEPKCCFSIIGPITPGELEEKSLDVVCKNELECNTWMEYLEVIIHHFEKNRTIKTKVEIRKKLDDDNTKK